MTHIKNKKNDVTNQKPSPCSTKTNTRLARTKCARKEEIVNDFFYSLYQILTLNVSDKSLCITQYQRHGKKRNLPFLPNKSKSCLYLLHRVNCEAVKKKSPNSHTWYVSTHPTTCLFAHLDSLFFNSPLMLSFKLPCQRSCQIKFNLVQHKSFWLESRIARLIIMLIGQFSVFFITAQLCAQDKRIQSESM